MTKKPQRQTLYAFTAGRKRYLYRDYDYRTHQMTNLVKTLPAISLGDFRGIAEIEHDGTQYDVLDIQTIQNSPLAVDDTPVWFQIAFAMGIVTLFALLAWDVVTTVSMS